MIVTFLCNERLIAGQQFQSRWAPARTHYGDHMFVPAPMPAIGLLRSVATELGDMVAVE
ncbi:hypothetical protein X772_27260 [Mesorhizobium sp. LSJC280B00]|nr:hypothetical protein X772_27260 [Mesorhizobium sp. LSJC280B00]